MLPLDPPIAALHGQRIHHSRQVADGLLGAAENLTSSALRMHGAVLARFSARAREHAHPLTPMMLMDIATDPTVTRLGVDFVHEQIRLAADLGERWVAFGEWHQHGMNALLNHWLQRFGQTVHGLPLANGVDVMCQAVESADRAVSELAAISANTTEAIAEEAVRVEERFAPRRRGRG